MGEILTLDIVRDNFLKKSNKNRCEDRIIKKNYNNFDFRLLKINAINAFVVFLANVSLFPQK